MMRIIRPAGLIAFVIITSLLLLFWLLLADTLLKQAIERTGSHVVGAKVELESAQLQLSPLGFQLNQLAVAHPNKPMQNQFEIAQIKGELALLPLLMGQVIIHQLAAEGVKLNTPRSHSGAIPQDQPNTHSSTTTSVVAAPSEDLTLPDFETLLNTLPIQSIALAEQFSKQSQQQIDTLRQSFAQLPDQAKLEEYQARLNALLNSKPRSAQEIQQQLTDFKALRQQLKHEQQQLSEFKQQLHDAKHQLSRQWKDLKQAPEADLALLEQYYPLKQGNLGNIVGLLFGDTAKQWLEYASPYLGHIKQLATSKTEDTPPPPPARGDGRFVHFATDHPKPDFLIEQAIFQLQLEIGSLQIEAQNLTHQPTRLALPSTVSISANQLATIEEINIDGKLDYRDPQHGFSQFKGQITGWQLTDIELAESSNNPISISQAIHQINGKLRIEDNQIEGQMESQIRQLNWQQSDRPSPLQQLLATVTQFDTHIDINGEIDSPQLQLNSDLDRRLSAGFKQRLSEERDQLKTKLRHHLNQKISSSDNDYQQQLGELTGGSDQQQEKIEEMLKAKLSNELDNQKEQLKDKLKDKFKGLF